MMFDPTPLDVCPRLRPFALLVVPESLYFFLFLLLVLRETYSRYPGFFESQPVTVASVDSAPSPGVPS
jgi:hypothetical protein